MKHERVILDTGPLVALLNKRDNYHPWAKAQFDRITPPLLTCEAVLSEACFLLQKFSIRIDGIMSLLERRLILIPFHLEEELSPVKKLMQSYQNVPMSLADGCLVRMSEQISESAVFTVDNDFTIYRKNQHQIIPSIMPHDR